MVADRRSPLPSSQSRTRSLNPPSLTLAHFPSPTSSPSTLPALSHVLSLLLPLHVTLPLSLDLLNSVLFAPESVNEDLHSGYLQLAHGTTVLMTEGGIQEGKLVERGVLNVRAIQEVLSTQTLAYKFPFSEFSFPTDIGFVILAEGTKSALFQVRKQQSLVVYPLLTCSFRQTLHYPSMYPQRVICTSQNLT